MIHPLFAWAVGVVFLVLLLVPNAATGAEPRVLEHGDARGQEMPCVLMANQNVLFGTAHQRGEYVIVRRDDDSEIQLNRKDVACWAKSIRGLYQFRVAHRRLSGLDAHLESARWCLRYELFDLASRELQAAYRIDPRNQAARRLEQQVRRAAEVKVAGPVVRDPTKPLLDADAVQLAAHETIVPVADSFDAAILHQFAAQVQPVLMNRCGSCHASQSERVWQLNLAATGSRASARMTKANLSATMPYVNAEKPLESELYVRAIDGHAGKKVSLGPHAVVATRSLSDWLRRVRHISAVQEDRQTTASSPVPTAQSVLPASHTASPPITPANKPRGITRLPAVSNPFDPELFNRRYARDAKAKELLRSETK